MAKCPCCSHEETVAAICSRCGFDMTKDFLSYRSLGKLSADAAENMILRRKDEERKKESEKYQELGQNKGKVLERIKKTATQGHASSQYILGLMYYEGDGIAKDINKAKLWLGKAAESGYEDARNFLDKITTGWFIPDDL